MYIFILWRYKIKYLSLYFKIISDIQFGSFGNHTDRGSKSERI